MMGLNLSTTLVTETSRKIDEEVAILIKGDTCTFKRSSVCRKQRKKKERKDVSYAILMRDEEQNTGD